MAAALCLVLYGTFLGTEGEAYRWARRYGVVCYFGGTCIAMLIVADAAHRPALLARRVTRALLALCLALPLLGLANVAASVLHVDDASRAVLQNTTEWWGGLIFTLFFVALAWLWRGTRFEIGFALRGDV